MEYRISDKMKDMKPSAIREIFKSLADPSIIAFAAGNPSAESFPAEAIRKIAADILENDTVTALQYSITEGYPPLREAVIKRLSDKFGIGRDNDMTIITSGGQQGLELACKVLCNEGDTVISEQPSFIGALNSFRSLGAKIAGVPLDNDGMNIDRLERVLGENPDAKFIYTIPTFQNPAGITMSLEKRCRLYECAIRHRIMILEDNPYGELRFAGRELPTLKSMDTEGIVIYCGSFSKILSAGMRVGFVTAPEPVLQKMVVAKQVEDVHTNILVQMICSKYIAEYDLDSHIDSIRALYRRKCGLMLSMLEKELPEGVSFTRPEGGLFVWVTYPDRVDITALTNALLAEKVAVVPGSAFNCNTGDTTHSIRLNYSTPSDEQIERGIKILGSVSEKFM